MRLISLTLSFEADEEWCALATGEELVRQMRKEWEAFASSPNTAWSEVDGEEVCDEE